MPPRRKLSSTAGVSPSSCVSTWARMAPAEASSNTAARSWRDPRKLPRTVTPLSTVSTNGTSTGTAVVLRGLRRYFGATKALDGLDLTLNPGELVALLGPSGCGKTTTLRMIAGLELPTSGAIMIGGDDVTRIPASERDVSMVFQSYALFPHMNVLENVGYGLTVSGLPKSEVHTKAQVALTTVGLTGFDERLPSELSGGQHQRANSTNNPGMYSSPVSWATPTAFAERSSTSTIASATLRSDR